MCVYLHFITFFFLYSVPFSYWIMMWMFIKGFYLREALNKQVHMLTCLWMLAILSPAITSLFKRPVYKVTTMAKMEARHVTPGNSRDQSWALNMAPLPKGINQLTWWQTGYMTTPIMNAAGFCSHRNRFVSLI